MGAADAPRYEGMTMQGGSGSVPGRVGSRGTRESGSRILGLALALTCSLWLFASSAGAVVDSEELGQFGSEGAGAGQLLRSREMVSNPASGHLYVADSGNRRVDEFTAWGEFVRAWGWGVEDGSPELQVCGPAEPEVSPPASLCQRGLAGSGKGEFGDGSPFNVAVAGSGNIYVLDKGNGRVQEFSATGQFVLMFGGEVNKTTGGDVCTEASGNECQGGTSGEGPGEFSEGLGLAISQDGTVLVGDKNRIEEFEPDGSFKGELKIPGVIDGIAPAPTGTDLYVYARGEDDVRKLSSSGTELGSLKVHLPGGIAVDSEGNLYAIKQSTENEIVDGMQIFSMPQKVVEFSASGTELPSCCVPPFVPGSKLNRFSLEGLATSSVGDLYLGDISTGEGSHITFVGPPPVAIEPPPKVPPAVTDQFLVAAGASSATLEAKINPNFWEDTHYYLEYGTAACGPNPCTQQPAPPGAELGGGAVRKAINTSRVLVSGLSPDTTYHYRFVAESGGGGPVFGPDRTFRTFPAGGWTESCPGNEAFRTGAAARLADCRAFEMVSPVDKNNGDIISLIQISGFETRLDQSSADGDALTYSSYAAFGGPQGGPFTSQYLARRGGDGWSSEPLGGPLVGNFYSAAHLDNEFKAFSADLCESWLVPVAEPTLAPGAVEGFPNLYRRHNCPKSYEALSTTGPPSFLPTDYLPELQGHSADGASSIFGVKADLTPDSPAQPPACNPEGGQCQTRLYEASGGTLKYVCVFPEGTSAKAEAEFPNCSAGSPSNEQSELGINRATSVSHAISEDGSRIYWSASGEQQNPGKIYLRVNGTSTLAVSETQTTKAAHFWGASADGSKALFEVEDLDTKNPTAKDKNLYLYDLGSESSTLIAGKVTAVVAASEDLARVYFVSEEELPGTTGASAGGENLYLHEEGGVNTFVATLSAEDVEQAVPSDGAKGAVYHAARATPDGARLAFVSTEALTGFDNHDAESGEADSEVFSYDATSGELSCASCSPVGAQPTGRDIAGQAKANAFLWTAAAIPTGETQLYTPRALSDDGSKLFFTSYVPLLPADLNGKADVYEWEQAGSTPSCSGVSDPDYYAANGGCLFMISSGQSATDSELVDSSPSGRDVFFSTEESLLSQDPGQVDIYDAREGGGFPAAPEVVHCNPEGGTCQSPPAAPNFQGPASTVAGPGNPKPIVCAKGRHRAIQKGKEVCAKHKGNKGRHKHKGKKQAHKKAHETKGTAK